MKYRVHNDFGLPIFYTPALDGGGRFMSRNYLGVIRKLFGRVGRLHEWCAGPGFIGFAALADGLCDSLCLSDVNPAAIAALRETVQNNGLASRVSVYEADVLNGIPRSEQWDLVIGNPPHYRADTEEEHRANLLGYDPSWRLHRQFYASVAPYLKPNGSTLLIESYDGSTETDFLSFMHEGGLAYLGSFTHRPVPADETTIGGVDRFYYMWSSVGLPNAQHRSEMRRADAALAKAVTLSLSKATWGASIIELTANQPYRLVLKNAEKSRFCVGLLTEGGRFVWPYPRPIVVPPSTEHLTTIIAIRSGVYRLGHLDPSVHARELLWDHRKPIEHDLIATIRAV